MVDSPTTHESPTADELEKLVGLLTGYRISQCIFVAADLRVADLLADGPKTVDELSAATATHTASLYRVLRLLAGAGLLAEVAPRRFALTRLGAGLRTDVPGSPSVLARLVLQKSHWNPWGHLLENVRSGHSAFEQVHGMGLFEYLERHPEEGRLFDEAMTESTKRDGITIAHSYDFSDIATVVDVGGGQGLLLASLLRANSHLHGILFDVPNLIAHGSPLLGKWGVADRCTAVGGSFFDDLPSGAGAYLLRHIIHDWDDDKACRILRNCRDAAAPGGKVLVVERLLGTVDRAGLALLANDIEMMVNVGGKERSEAEFRELFEQAGLRISRIIGPVDAGGHVIMEGQCENI
jgi:hypothetical protein